MFHLSQKKPPAVNTLLIAIVALGFAVRLFGLTNSVTDWHAFRQVDTASVTREYVKRGVDFLHPRYQDLGNTQSGKDNPEGYRMVEFPIVNAVLATLLRIFPFLNLEVTSRMFSILFSLGTIVCLYFLGKRWANQTIGYLSALSFAILPYAVFYSRVILPEPFFVFFLTFAVLTFDLWLEEKEWQKKWTWYTASFLALTVALLLKPFALFFGLIFAYLALRHFKHRAFLQPALYVYVLSLVPLFLWRNWITNYPEGIPASDFLFNKDNIRLRPAWFRWLGWERYTKMIMGGTGMLAAVASVFAKNKLRELIIVWGACVAAYLIVIAGGNVQHDYYQSITLPVVALAVGQGLYVIASLKDVKKLIGLWLLAVAVIIVISRFPEPGFTPQFQISHFLVILLAGVGAYLIAALRKAQLVTSSAILVSISFLVIGVLVANWFVSGYYRTRPDLEEAGAAVQRLTPSDAKVIAPLMTDTMLLYQTNRLGWALGGEIEDKISKGATYYVSTAYDDEAKALEQKYQVVEKTDNHIIIKLSQ